MNSCLGPPPSELAQFLPVLYEKQEEPWLINLAETRRIRFSHFLNMFPHLISFFFFFLTNLFIYLFLFWLCWVFVAVRGLSLVAASGGYSMLWCAGFSLRWLLLLQSTDSRRAGFSSCGTWAQ